MVVDYLLVKIHPNCTNKSPIHTPKLDGDTGFDLEAWIEDGELELKPQTMANIKTGVYIKLPSEYWGNIRPRSSTFAKRKLFVMGGTIDSGYTGQISIFVWNPLSDICVIHNGDRLAQLIIAPRVILPIKMVKELPDTKRGENGFGSTDT